MFEDVLLRYIKCEYTLIGVECRGFFFIYQNNIKPSLIILKRNISFTISNFHNFIQHNMEINYDQNQLIIILIACMELILF